MPIRTPHYQLTAFQYGDAYSASADRRRFSIIDNQMDFLAEQIGDGVIDGWVVNQLDSTTVRVGPGMGIIDGFLTVTHGNFDVELPNNRRLYLFMRRKPDIIADVGPFCEIESIDYEDLTPPTIPSGLSESSKTYRGIDIEWNANSDIDIFYYEVLRSSDGVSFDLIAETENPLYSDDNLDQNTSYWYALKAVDLNGNKSDQSPALEVITEIDDRVPIDPSEVQVFAGNETLQVYWGASDFLAETYEITLQPVTLDLIPEGSPFSYSVDNTTFFYIVQDLINGQRYKITVKAVSKTGYKSEGLSGFGVPTYSGGASELSTIDIEDFALDSSFRLGLNLSWTLQESEYVADPDYFLVTIFRDGETGVPSIYTNQDITVVRYTVNINGNDVQRDIEEETLYNIRIQTVSGDIQSSGFVVKFRTKKFRPPASITELTVNHEFTVNNRSVTATWENSISSFAYNLLTVIKVPLDADDEYVDDLSETVIEDLNYGQSTNYTLPPSLVENMYRYEFYITTYDIYGNSSQTVSGSTVISKVFESTTVGGIEIIDSGQRPPVPSEQFVINGDDQSTLYWNEAESDFIEGYRVYRANFDSAYNPEDFELITEPYLPANVRKYTDYYVDNKQRYVYFVTTVDVFGNESPNPSDGFMSYSLLYSSPRSYSALDKAPSINLSKDGQDVVVSWLPSGEAFDGYQVFRSEGNLYSFEPIGSVNTFDTEFRDVGALKKDGKYYYMIRKFRNEAEIVISRNRLSPAGAVAVGMVARSNDNVIIDQSDLYDLKLLADPIRDEVANQLSVPTHLFYGIGDDRRIRLQNDLVISEWSTIDFQNYTTTFSLDGTEDYIAYIDGRQSPYSTVVNRDDMMISFEQPIFDPSVNDGVPEEYQTEPPEVSVIFRDVSEVQGILSQDNVEDIMATKVTKGKLTVDELPPIDHFGRYREKLIPEQHEMRQTNPFEFTDSTPDGFTFYDFVKTPNNLLVAASSAGVLVQSIFSPTGWETVLTTEYAASRIIYSSFLQLYFVACGNKVRMSSDLETWRTPTGMEGVNIIRDLVEDEKGSVYASTDSGVYQIQPLEFTKLFWEQLDLFDPLDANAYGLHYDTDADILYIGGGSGLFASLPDGDSYRIDYGEIKVPCHTIWMENGYTFLVSSNKVWRMGPDDTEFKVIGDFAVQCRKGVVFADEFYVTTDEGLYKSSPDNNVFTDTFVRWEVAFKNLQRNNIVPPTFGLRVFDNRIWLGQDETLHSATATKRTFTHADLPGTCPTIYVDTAERSVGAFWGHGNKVLFDEAVEPPSKVFIVRSYTAFTAPNGGWADTKFDAEVLITINGRDIIGPPRVELIDGRFWRFPPTPWKPPSTPSFVAGALNQITMPDFYSRNSNFEKANASLREIVYLSDQVAILQDIGQEFVPSEMVADVFKELDRFKTHIHPDLRDLIKYPPITGTINYNGFTATYDVVNGEIFIQNGLNKYTRVELSVKGVAVSNFGFVSHDEIEESFEKWNSGLTIPMAFGQQSNLIKMGIYHQRIDPDQIGKNHTYQAIHHSACDQDWYDRLLSTVDFETKLEQNPPIQGSGEFRSNGFSIEYPADILYLPSLEEVWVCGQGGIIGIDTSTYDVRKVFGSPFYFLNMNLSEGFVYALSEDGLYRIDPSTGETIKDVNLNLPDNFSSVYVSGDTTYIATDKGVYSKRPFEVDWIEVFPLDDATIRSTSRLTFAMGRHPEDNSDSAVYYSFGGVIWNRSNIFTDIRVNSVTQRFNSVYYATNSGVLVENLSRLFSNNDFSGPVISPIELEENQDNTKIRVNDVDADDTRVIAVTDNGKWYSLGDGNSGESRLQTIHKVKVVEGKYWLFADNLIEIENEGRLVQLSTGKALL